MPTNIEIKAHARDPEGLAARAAALAGGPPEEILQRDTFFACAVGRLKLRELGSGRSELIWYDRGDAAGSKRSEYLVAPVADAAGLRALLGRAGGGVRIVEKRRMLFLVGQTRVHLDDVTALGHFVELEVVLREGQAEEEGHAIAAEIMQRLGIAPEDLLAGAYVDMLGDGTA